MSLGIRYLTNGKKYAPEGKPMFVGPDGARNLFAMKALYPDLMNEHCNKPGYSGDVCIFESCKEPWKTCKYRYTESGT